jgi:hypothetical protein
MCVCTGRHDWFYYTSTKCAIPDDMCVHINIHTCILTHTYIHTHTHTHTPKHPRTHTHTSTHTHTHTHTYIYIYTYMIRILYVRINTCIYTHIIYTHTRPHTCIPLVLEECMIPPQKWQELPMCADLILADRPAFAKSDQTTVCVSV